MVDRDLMLRKMAHLDTYLIQLGAYAGLTEGDYRSDWKTQRIVDRTLHLVIETCMDIADHVVADQRLRVPDTGAATFEILGEAGVLPQELAAALAKMVGFRDILVHDYAKLDPAIVVRALTTNLEDVRRFRAVVLTLR